MPHRKDHKRPKRSTAVDVTTLPAVYNIFVTSSKLIARHMSKHKLKKGASMRDFLSQKPGVTGKKDHDPSLGYGYHMLSTRDANVLEFTHGFNFGQGKNAENSIVLKTVEPGLEVMKRFFFLFMQENLGSIKWRKDAFLSRVGSIKEEQAVASYWEDLATATTPRYDKYGLTLTDMGSYKKKSTEAASKVADAREELVDYCKSNSVGQKLYIAYGVGDNLDEWAGPFQVLLGQLDYNNDGREETVTYTFRTDHIAQTFADRHFGAIKSIGLEPINFIRPTIPIAAFDYEATNFKSSWGLEGKGIKLDSFTPSLHDTVVKLISYYLYGLGIKNHIVVLPNLDLLLASQVAQAIGVNDWHKLFKTKQDFDLWGDPYYSEATARGLESYGGYNYALSEDYYGKYGLQPAKELINRIRQLFMQLFSWETTTTGAGIYGIGDEVKEWLGVDEDYVLTLRDKIDLLLTVMSKIGMKVNKSEEQSNATDSVFVNMRVATDSYEDKEVHKLDEEGGGGVVAFTKNLVKKYDIPAFLKIPISDPFGGKSSWRSTPEKADAVLNIELPFQHLQDNVADKNGAQYMSPIVQIVNSMLAAGGQQYVSIGYHWENDIKIVDMLKQKFGSGTFEGYQQVFKGSTGWLGTRKPPPHDDNYFIFGDQELIKLFVYGEYASAVDFNKNARLEATRFWEGIPIEFSTQQGKGKWKSYYFVDPFWNSISEDLNKLTVSEEQAKEKDQEFVEDFFQRQLTDSWFTKMRSLVKKPWLDMGHFNEYDLNPEYRFEFVRRLPDEFGWLNDTDTPKISKAIKSIFNLGPAIFVGNDTHGNVLSYSFENNQFILGQFLGTLKELYYNTTTAYSTKLKNPVLDGEPSDTAMRTAMYAALKHISAFGKHGGAFGTVFPDLESVNIAGAAIDLTDIMLQESTGPTRYVAKGGYSSVISMITLFMNLFKYSYQGVITTLPMFGLSNMGILQRPAIVLLKSTGKVKPASETGRSTADFFSGLYKVFGFKHTITRDDAKSEFVVVKDVHGILGNETTDKQQ